MTREEYHESKVVQYLNEGLDLIAARSMAGYLTACCGPPLIEPSSEVLQARELWKGRKAERDELSEIEKEEMRMTDDELYDWHHPWQGGRHGGRL